MKKVFNYNLKHKLKASILLSALSIGVFMGGNSCSSQEKIATYLPTKTQKTTREINIEKRDSLYNDVISYGLDILQNSKGKFDYFNNYIKNYFIYDVVNDTINDNYTKINNFYTDLLYLKPKQICTDEEFKKLLETIKTCELYLGLSERLIAEDKLNRFTKNNQRYH